jgi:hypothetical protein
LVVANFSSAPAHGHVHLPKGWLPGGTSFICQDPLNEDRFQRSTSEVESDGLYVGLDQKDFHFFRIEKE